MGVLGWLLGSGRSAPPAAARVLPPKEIARFGEWSMFQCCICGAVLGSDPDDSLHAEGPNRHLCGDCYRTREWEAILEHEYFDDH
jgi:hypothetical protein